MFRRFYHVSCVTCSFKKQSMKLNKMLNPKSKKQWYPADMFEAKLPSVKSLTKVKHEPGKQALRRITMLNKMFMKHITDIMSTGTVSMDVVGRGIEISKVKVTPDLQSVNVFWVCKGNAKDEETENFLSSIAGALRHELSTLRLMGEVPYISFVKDKEESQVMELDRRLAIADYGEDYTPTDLGHLLKSEFTLDTKLSPEMKAKIKRLEDQTEFEEETIPEMTNTVFGLDHEKIMNRILAARKKSQEAWSSLNEESVVTYRTPGERVSTVDPGQQKQELAEFLQKRQILQNKRYKLMKELQKEYQPPPNETEEEYSEPLDDIDDFEKYEEQLYEEDYYNKHSSQLYKINEKLDSKM